MSARIYTGGGDHGETRLWDGQRVSKRDPRIELNGTKRMGLKKYNIYNIKDNISMGTSHLSWLGRSFAREDWVMAAFPFL